ncbi:MAG: 16S rRNA (cytosine(967)-C(5))-methyltransferase RsmB [Erysipelotrichaceae bacterium]|nr:16S rRNA (cytosine(967)-C(5))-methyltransferase RsmB [Erysipelotrichaceae bacterium]
MIAREEAYHILTQVVVHKQYANLLLKNCKGDPVDMPLITRIVYGTLQHYRYLEYQWSDLVSKRPPEEIVVLISMSVYQRYMMDKIPPYAIINEAVSIAKKNLKGQYAGLVNAILRQVLTRHSRPVFMENKAEQLAIETSHPVWLVHMWRKQLGDEATETICHKNNLTPPLYVRVNTLLSDMDEVMKSELFTVSDEKLGSLIALPKVVKHEMFTSGKVMIQDENSQRVCVFADVKPGEKVLDVCSAPGTKTVQLAAMMQNQGSILALDIHSHRIKLVEQLIEKSGATIIETKVADATNLPVDLKEGMFDTVLIDAPCSGLGVLRRKPDIKMTIQPADLDGIQKLQESILNETSPCVKVGGHLVYATCTINKKENQLQVQSFLSTHPQFELVDQQQYLPHQNDGDGFYMAKLIRVQ